MGPNSSRLQNPHLDDKDRRTSIHCPAGFVCSSLLGPRISSPGAFPMVVSRSLVLGMGKKPTVPEVLALGDYHGKTSKVGTAGLGECSLVSVVVYLVILAVNESMSIRKEGGPRSDRLPGVRMTQTGGRMRRDTEGMMGRLCTLCSQEPDFSSGSGQVGLEWGVGIGTCP